MKALKLILNRSSDSYWSSDSRGNEQGNERVKLIKELGRIDDVSTDAMKLSRDLLAAHSKNKPPLTNDERCAISRRYDSIGIPMKWARESLDPSAVDETETKKFKVEE